MAEFEKHASVTVESDGDTWTVRVDDDGSVTEQEFGTEDEAEEFAHSQRMLLGLVPQQDLA